MSFIPTHIAALGNSQDGQQRIRRQARYLRPADVIGMHLVQFEDKTTAIVSDMNLTPIPQNEPKPTIVDGTTK